MNEHLVRNAHNINKITLIIFLTENKVFKVFVQKKNQESSFSSFFLRMHKKLFFTKLLINN